MEEVEEVEEVVEEEEGEVEPRHDGGGGGGGGGGGWSERQMRATSCEIAASAQGSPLSRPRQPEGEPRLAAPEEEEEEPRQTLAEGLGEGQPRARRRGACPR